MQQIVKTYKTNLFHYADKLFAQDLPKMLAQGWQVQSQSAIPGSYGGHPRSIIVVYVKGS